MQVALEVSYYNIDDTPAADEVIRAHVERLERNYARIASCRVRVAQRAANDNRARLPAVLIELGITGNRNVVVSHEPGRLERAYPAPDVNNAIHEAFEKAERELRELKKIHEINSLIAGHGGDLGFLGEIAEVYPLQDHGYLLNKDGARLYFHRDAIVQGDFDYLVRGTKAYYVEEKGAAGPLATRIWVRYGD